MRPSRRRGSSGKTSATAARTAAIQAAEKRRREEQVQEQELQSQLQLQSQAACGRNIEHEHETDQTSTAKSVCVGEQHNDGEEYYISHNNTHDDDSDSDNDNGDDNDEDDDVIYDLGTDNNHSTNSHLNSITNTNSNSNSNTNSNEELGKKREKVSLLQPFGSHGPPYCKIVPDDKQPCIGSSHSQPRFRKSGYKRKEDFDYSEEEDDGDDDDDEDSDDEGCLHCHRKVKHLPRIRVIDDDDEDDDEHDPQQQLQEQQQQQQQQQSSAAENDSYEGDCSGGINIQVRCDDCRGYICNGCHWCHEFQANHEIRVCDRCDAFYCRGCDEMDQCDDCGEVVCGSCSTLLSCKFCGGGLCEECATACGRCGIVLCSRDAKFAVDCDTCRLSYCLVCLASGSKDPCVRCGHRPSKRMEQLVHLRLKSIYKAFKSSSSGANNNSSSGVLSGAGAGAGASGTHNNNHSNNGSGTANGLHESGSLHGNGGHKGGHGGRSRRNKPTTLQDMVGDHDDEEDERIINPTVSMMMGAAAGVLPHKFCHDLEQNYLAEQKKADAAAEALLAELEEEETAIAQKKSKKKKKKERKNATKNKQQNQNQRSSGGKSGGIREKDESSGVTQTIPSTRQGMTTTTTTTTPVKTTPAKTMTTNRESDPMDGDASSKTDSLDQATKDNDDREDKATWPEEMKMDPVEKELVDCVNSFDLDGIESILFRLKGVPGRAALRKNAKKALKRLKLEINPPLVEAINKTEKKPMASSTRASPTITKVPVVVVDPKIQSKKTTAKSSTGHEKTNYNSSTKSSHPKSSLHKTNSSARCEAQVEIVSRLVGWMIGKNGQRIRDLMEESGAKIWIDQEKFKGQETRNVYISGDRKSVEHAVTLVNDVVINAPPPQGSAHAMAAATAAMATMNISPKASEHTVDSAALPATVEVKSAWAKSSDTSAGKTPPGTIPKPPALISSSAPVVIEKLQEHSTVHAPTVKEPPGITRNLNAIPTNATNVAIDHSLVSNLRQKSTELTTEVVTCEARFVPLLIGKRGWTIKHIQDDSGARVDIDQSVTPRQVRISGIKANVDKAVTLVRDVLSYPHAQLQSSSDGVVDDVGSGLPNLATNIQQSGGPVPVATPIQQKLLAASAVLERDATRNTIPRQDESSDRVQSPPPLVGDAKSAISASSSLSSTPEPSMASSSKGFIAPHLQCGPLLHPPAEQYNIGSNQSHSSPSRFLQPEGGTADALGARGLWQSAGLGPVAIGAVAPQPLYAESAGQMGMQVGGQIMMPQAPPPHTQIHQQLQKQQQNQHLRMSTEIILEQQEQRGNPKNQQQRLHQSFSPTALISHGMNLASNPSTSPMERHTQFSNQSIGTNQLSHNIHSTLGAGGAPYNLYNSEGVPTARAIATTPLRDLMQHTGGGGASTVPSPMRASSYREGSSGLWNSGNPNFSSSGLPSQPSGLQPPASSGFSAASMGFTPGQLQQNNESRINNSFGYTTSQLLTSQHNLSHANRLPIESNESTHFSSSMSSGLRNDDSLMIDSFFGHASTTVPKPNNSGTNGLLTGFNGLALSSGAERMKSSGLWGSSDLTETWRQNEGNDMHDESDPAQNVAVPSIGNFFSNDVQDLPQESRFNWDSNTNI